MNSSSTCLSQFTELGFQIALIINAEFNGSCYNRIEIKEGKQKKKNVVIMVCIRKTWDTLYIFSCLLSAKMMSNSGD